MSDVTDTNGCTPAMIEAGIERLYAARMDERIVLSDVYRAMRKLEPAERASAAQLDAERTAAGRRVYDPRAVATQADMLRIVRDLRDEIEKAKADVLATVAEQQRRGRFG